MKKYYELRIVLKNIQMMPNSTPLSSDTDIGRKGAMERQVLGGHKTTADKSKTKLGSGSFGSVFTYGDSASRHYIVKKFRSQPGKDCTGDALKEIIRTMIVNGHRTYTFFYSEAAGSPRLYEFMPIIKGPSLYKWLGDLNMGFVKDDTFEKRMKFFVQAYYQIRELHYKQIFHWDVKPQNIMLDEGENLHLIDMGGVSRPKKNIVEPPVQTKQYSIVYYGGPANRAEKKDQLRYLTDLEPELVDKFIKSSEQVGLNMYHRKGDYITTGVKYDLAALLLCFLEGLTPHPPFPQQHTREYAGLGLRDPIKNFIEKGFLPFYMEEMVKGIVRRYNIAVDPNRPMFNVMAKATLDKIEQDGSKKDFDTAFAQRKNVAAMQVKETQQQMRLASLSVKQAVEQEAEVRAQIEAEKEALLSRRAELQARRRAVGEQAGLLDLRQSEESEQLAAGKDLIEHNRTARAVSDMLKSAPYIYKARPPGYFTQANFFKNGKLIRKLEKEDVLTILIDTLQATTSKETTRVVLLRIFCVAFINRRFFHKEFTKSAETIYHLVGLPENSQCRQSMVDILGEDIFPSPATFRKRSLEMGLKQPDHQAPQAPRAKDYDTGTVLVKISDYLEDLSGHSEGLRNLMIRVEAMNETLATLVRLKLEGAEMDGLIHSIGNQLIKLGRGPLQAKTLDFAEAALDGIRKAQSMAALQASLKDFMELGTQHDPIGDLKINEFEMIIGDQLAMLLNPEPGIQAMIEGLYKRH